MDFLSIWKRYGLFGRGQGVSSCCIASTNLRFLLIEGKYRYHVKTRHVIFSIDVELCLALKILAMLFIRMVCNLGGESLNVSDCALIFTFVLFAFTCVPAVFSDASGLNGDAGAELLQPDTPGFGTNSTMDSVPLIHLR